MKKIKIAGITFVVIETTKGLYFRMDKKPDILSALKLGAPKVIKEIQSVLDGKFGKNQFFYKGGKSIEQDGFEFNYTPGKLINRL